jgi:hypothetical protein
MMELRSLAPDLWVCDRRLRVAGLEIGTRMSVIRLKGGGLFLHSPVALGPALRAELAQLGEIRHVVAPNLHHHLYLADYAGIPGVRLYASPGLPEKKRGLRFDEVLTDTPPAAWRGEIDQHCFAGAPFLQEVVVCHRASRTLFLTDLAFNFVECAHTPTRWWLRAMGGLGRFGPPRHVRWLMRDRNSARRSADVILGWDIERVVVTHGVVLSQSAKRVLRESFLFLGG